MQYLHGNRYGERDRDRDRERERTLPVEKLRIDPSDVNRN